MGVFDSIANFIGGLATNYANARENQKNREWSEKMWNLNNQYNSPSAVLSRFADAGIQVNPNFLVTGSYNGGLSSYAGNADTSRKMENPVNGVGILDSYMQIKNLKNSTRQTDSNIKTNNSIQAKNLADAEKANTEANVNRKIAEYKSTENKYQESNIILDLAKKNLEKSALQLTVNYTKDANPLQLSILKEQVEKAKFEKKISENTANLILEQINTQIEETKLVQEKQQTEKTQQELNRSGSVANYARAEADKASARANLASANYYGELAETERQLRPSQKEKLENEAFKLLRDVREIDSRINLNETQAKNLILNTVIAYNRFELDKWIATVRDAYGTNVATVVTNYGRDIGLGLKERFKETPKETWDRLFNK